MVVEDDVWQAMDTLSVHDPAGRFVHISTAAQRDLGTAPEVLLGQSWTDRVHPEDLESVLTAIEEVRCGASVVVAYRFLAPEAVWVEATLRPFATGFIATSRRLTYRIPGQAFVGWIDEAVAVADAATART